MDWRDALEIVIAQTQHERYRQLCADEHPQHEAWRALIVSQVTGEPMLAPSAIEPPSLAIETGIGWVPPLGPCGGC